MSLDISLLIPFLVVFSSAGYVTYDRGTSVDPAKRYVNVPLTEAKAFIDS